MIRKEEDMPESIKCKISKLRYKRLITEDEYIDLIKKIDGHDRELYDKAYSEGKNHQLVAEIKIDADTMSKMLDEKLCELRAKILGMRNATIDEFAEKLKEQYKHYEETDGEMCEVIYRRIDNVVEQMKGGV